MEQHIENRHQCIFKYACRNNDIVLIKTLLDNYEININKNDDCSFCWLCSKGYIDIITYLLNLPNNNININTLDDFPFRVACQNGHIDVIKLLLSIEGNNIDVHKIFYTVCKNNKIEIVKTLGRYMLDEQYNIYEAFSVSCSLGHNDVIKELIKISNGELTINKDDTETIDSICKNGHVDVIDILLENVTSKINILQNHINESFDDGYTRILTSSINIHINEIGKFCNEILNSLCKYGRLLKIKYMFNHNLCSKFDIDVNSLFSVACEYVQIDIIKYFLNIKGNDIECKNSFGEFSPGRQIRTITLDNEFGCACLKNNIILINFFCTFSCAYHCVIKNEKVTSWNIIRGSFC
jgi:ankyrin repeat protein